VNFSPATLSKADQLKELQWFEKGGQLIQAEWKSNVVSRNDHDA